MNEYEKQAQDFLNATGTTINVERAEVQTPPNWGGYKGKHGIKYDVTIKNARAEYKFPFWDSIANAEKYEALVTVKNFSARDTSAYFHAQDLLKKELGVKLGWAGLHKKFDEYADKLKPGAYDILACLDQLYSDSFEDFCAEFGYDTDSRTAESTYNAMLEQDRQLRRMYTLDELELLQEVN